MWSGYAFFASYLTPATLRRFNRQQQEGLMMRRAILLVASGVALAVTKIGTDGPDTLRGTDGDDKLIGKGGNDILFALRGDDNLLGGPGNDIVLGGNEFRPLGGEKNLDGGSGNDVVNGGKGSDNLVGGGNDFLSDGEFDNAVRDNLSAGAGNDALDVINRTGIRKDVVACGSGFDRVLADRKDVVAPDCERVFVGLRNADAFDDSILQSFFNGLNPEIFG